MQISAMKVTVSLLKWTKVAGGEDSQNPIAVAMPAPFYASKIPKEFYLQAFFSPPSPGAEPRRRDRRLPNPGDGGVAARPRARRALRTDEGVRAAAGGARAGQRILPVQAARLCQLRVFRELLPERLALLPTVTSFESEIQRAGRDTIWPRIQVNI